MGRRAPIARLTAASSVAPTPTQGAEPSTPYPSQVKDRILKIDIDDDAKMDVSIYRDRLYQEVKKKGHGLFYFVTRPFAGRS